MNYTETDLIVLKGLVTDKKLAHSFLQKSDSKVFSGDLWKFANIVTSYINTFKEVPTYNILEKKFSSNESSLSYFKEIHTLLDKVEFNQKEYPYYLDQLNRRTAEKSIIELSSKLSKLESGKVDFKKVELDLQRSISDIRSIDEKRTYEKKTVKEHLSQFVEEFKFRREHPEITPGIKTGYSFYDYATGGIKSSDFVVVCGESGSGKSLLLQNFAIQMWMQDNDFEMSNFNPGKNILFFSLEMPYANCFNRFISRLARVNYSHIDNPPMMSKEEFKRLKKAMDFIHNFPNNYEIIDLVNAKSSDVESIYNETCSSYEPDIVIVDYLGIMEPDNSTKEEDWLKQNQVTLELRRVSRTYDKGFMSAVQLNRKPQAKDPESNIGLHRLARSISVATHCTQILQIHARENEDAYFDSKMSFTKNRNGPKITGVLNKDFSCGLFTDIPYNEVENSSISMDDISEELDGLDLDID